MKLLTVDFETFYDKDYSLSKLSTEAYIHDTRFETIGVSVKEGRVPAQWFSGTHAATKKFLSQFDWSASAAIAHNAMFDMAILNWLYDIRPKKIIDTLSMGKALHGAVSSVSLKALAELHNLGAKGNEVVAALGMRRLDFSAEALSSYAAYCCNDVELTYALYRAMAPGFPHVEYELIDITMRMFTEPTLVLNKPMLEEHLIDVRDKKAALLENQGFDKKDLMSNPKFAELLKSLDVEPPMKISPKTGKEAYAFAKTDEEFKKLQDHENPRVQALVAARLGNKSTLEETRTEAFIGVAERCTAFPIPLAYYGTHTGRWAGKDKLNLQNLPRGKGSKLKASIVAPEGYSVLDCDSSQIEARILAWLSGQWDLVDIFEKNNAEIAAGVKKQEHKHDPYKITAAEIYNKAINEIEDAERFVGKTSVLSCVAEGTPVLTDCGWVKIEQITHEHKLWDGVGWVCHQGLVKKGFKKTLSVYGSWLTPDHKVLCGTTWTQAQYLARDENIRSLALGTGAVNWWSLVSSLHKAGGFKRSLFGAIAALQNIWWTGTILRHSRVPDAIYAPLKKVMRRRNSIGDTQRLYQTTNTGDDFSVEYRPVFSGATHRQLTPFRIMAGEELRFARSGAKESLAGKNFSHIWGNCRDGMSLVWKLIVSTITRDTSPATSGSPPDQKTRATNEKSEECSRNLMTYDIALAGPRNRFTIATNAGPIIVHNCGYGAGWLKFQSMCKVHNHYLSDEECARVISIYRQTYPEIPKLWREGNVALQAVADGSCREFGKHGVVIVSSDGVHLPNGLFIRYPEPRIIYDEDGRKQFSYMARRSKGPPFRMKMWGGTLTENVCQALARIIIGEQMIKVAQKYRVALTVHDSLVCLAKDAEAEEAADYIGKIMRTPATWAAGLPLNCEIKIGKSYG